MPCLIKSFQGMMKGKPEPEIFLKACSKMNIPPSEALVFEDSIAGIEAAKGERAFCLFHQRSFDRVARS